MTGHILTSGTAIVRASTTSTSDNQFDRMGLYKPSLDKCSWWIKPNMNSTWDLLLEGGLSSRKHVLEVYEISL